MIRYKSPLEFKVTSIYFCLEGLHWKSITKQNEKSTVFALKITHPGAYQGGGGGEGALPPARPKQVQSALNKKLF